MQFYIIEFQFKTSVTLTSFSSVNILKINYKMLQIDIDKISKITIQLSCVCVTSYSPVTDITMYTDYQVVTTKNILKYKSYFPLRIFFYRSPLRG